MDKTIQHSHLKQRLNNAWDAPDSCKWVRSLVDALETLHKRDADTHLIRSTFLELPHATSRTCWELSRIPVLLRYEEREVLERYGDMRIQSGVWWKNRFHEIGSDTCPEDVVTNRNNTVWCFYEPHLAKKMDFEIIHTWDQDDSIVDWVTNFVQEPQTYSAEITEQDKDITCMITDMSALTTKQQLLRYIHKNAPVSTRQILEQNFANKRHVYKRLRELVMDDEILKVEHGWYDVTPN